MNDINSIQARYIPPVKPSISDASARPVARAEQDARAEPAAIADQPRPDLAAASMRDYSTQLLLEKQFGVTLNSIREKVLEIFRSQGLDTQGIEQLSPEEAKAQIGADGYWGVEKTAARIADFAVQAAGGDPARLDALKAAIQSGFDAAKTAFGGTLPDISQQTLTRVWERLDKWAVSGAEAPPPDRPDTHVNLSV